MWTIPLLSAIAAAAPLDDAAADGRPIIVVVTGQHRMFEAAIWLRSAEGEARARQQAVSLVYASPEELAAWVGQPALARGLATGSSGYTLVRLSPTRAVEDWVAVRVPDVLDVEPVSPSAPPLERPPLRAKSPPKAPPAEPPPGHRSGHHAPQAARAEEDDPRLDPFDLDDSPVDAAAHAVADAFDAALRELVPQPPGAPLRADATTPDPTILGTASCLDAFGCGFSCDLPPPLPDEPAAVRDRRHLLSGSAFGCGMGTVTALQTSFLIRWPP